MSQVHYQIHIRHAGEPAETRPATVTITTSEEGMQALLNRLMKDEDVARGVACHKFESLDHIFVHRGEPPRQMNWKQSIVEKLTIGATFIGCAIPMFTILAAIIVCIIAGGCSLLAWCFQLIRFVL